MFEQQREVRTERERVHMAENRTGQDREISWCWGLWLEGGEEGKEVGMALGIQLFLLLELTLQCRKISPKSLI